MKWLDEAANADPRMPSGSDGEPVRVEASRLTFGSQGHLLTATACHPDWGASQVSCRVDLFGRSRAELQALEAGVGDPGLLDTLVAAACRAVELEVGPW